MMAAEPRFGSHPMKHTRIADHPPGQQRLFAQLRLLLAQAQLAYECYLGNRLFLHALNIRTVNKRIIRLLYRQANFIPEPLAKDVAVLINHYETWLSEFSHHRRRQRPSLDSAFVFIALDPSNSFPKAAVARLIQYADGVALGSAPQKAST